MDNGTQEQRPAANHPSGGRRAVRGRLVLCAVILAAAGIGLATTVERGHTDAAMIFVGLPTVLALAIALGPPARSVHGLTFKAVSVALLITAVLLHEGAICVVLAAPLVFAVAHVVVALVRHSQRSAFAVLPLALLLGLEGMVPGLRMAPDQVVTATRTVPLPVAEVWHRIEAGPRPGTSRPVVLAAVPLPEHVAGAGLLPGDRWQFHFHGDSHGPGGELVTEVASSSIDGDGFAVEFVRVRDTSIVARWLDWSSARIEARATEAGTEVRLTLRFTRGLDPSWYFGPLQQVLVGAGAQYLLDSLHIAG